MKKLLSLLIAAALVFALCGCEEIPTIELPEETPQPTAAPEVTPEPAPETPEEPADPAQVIVSITRSVENQYAPDDPQLLLLEFFYDTARVYVDGAEEATAAINDLLSRKEEQFYTGNDYGDGYSDGLNGYLEMALDNYQYVRESGTELNLTFSATRTVDVKHIGERTLSMVLEDYNYTGGVHGMGVDTALVFDTRTGELLTLDAISDDGEALKAAIVDSLVTICQTDEDYAARLFETDDLAGTLGGIVREGKWYFGVDGLTVFSDPYEIGPYASGIITFTVPYGELEGVLKEEYLPVLRSTEATLTAGILTESSNIIDRVVDQEDGDAVMLTLHGAAEDVKISKVLYYDLESNSEFFETQTLWYCNFVRSSAVQLMTSLPDGMPNVMISYRDGQGEHRCLLSQSGENGDYVLVSDTIQPVG